jgi:hypothetical protein
MTYPLKPLSREAIPAALARAERYRLLNEPEQAESICEDVLAADPGNRDAIVMLILALSDRFPSNEGAVVGRARSLIEQLAGDYERAYYSGLVAERRARALVDRGGPGSMLTAGDWLRDAMRWFERAETVRPAGNDDARLRWNACVRLLTRHPNLASTPEDERTHPVMLE